MFADLVSHIIRRELETLRDELHAYPDETAIWRTPAGVVNSTGTLALHLAGNLQHFIGAQLGETGYVRDRDREFSARNVPLGELLAGIDAASVAVETTLGNLPVAQLADTYPLEVGGVRMQTGDFILQLVSHLAYHLGQVDYHRRIVTGEAAVVGALAIPKLHTATPVDAATDV